MRRITRPLLASLGLLLTLVGAVGLVVPLLPTTPFLLLAGLCFSRSSPRLHGWLLASPLLGRLVADWERHGAIRPRAKWACTLLLVGCVSWPIASGRVPPPVVPLVLLTVGAVAAFVWTRPDGPTAAAPARGLDPRAPSGADAGDAAQGPPPEEVTARR